MLMFAASAVCCMFAAVSGQTFAECLSEKCPSFDAAKRVASPRHAPRPQTPELLAVVRDGTDRRWARVSWKAAEGAEGYVVRYGPAPGKLHLSLMVRDACEAEVRALDTAQDYWWTVEAFNAAGFSAAMDVHKE